jgi:hypothetical protein
MGLGGGDWMQNILNGPTYTAFVGQDLLIITTDVPSMAHALDVLAGKQPSLAKQDPKKLKFDGPSGVLALGAGLKAGVNVDHSDDKSGAKKGRPPVDKPDAGQFGIDFFGSFSGKAQVGHFDAGEDDHSEYIDASISMVDADSAEQLKNLIQGVKAMVLLSQTPKAPLIAPLEIAANDKDVNLHWTWPTAKLSELARLTQDQGDHDTNVPATAPAQSPRH